MIFYLLAAINTLIWGIFTPLLVYYRRNPFISNRDYPLIIIGTTYMSLLAILHAVGYELYFDGHPTWYIDCRYLISWPTIISVSLTTMTILLRAYNIQFKFYMAQEKVKMNADFYHKWKHTATLKYNFYALIILFFILNLPALIAYLIIPFPDSPLNVTQCFSYFTYILLGQGAPLSMGLNFLLGKYLKLRDPYKIKVEFGWQFVTGFLIFVTWIVLQVYDTATGGVNFPTDFHPMYFISIFAFNMTICNLVYPVYLAFMDKRRDYAIADFDDGSRRGSVHQEVNLRTILGNQILFAAFRDTTIQYWCVESLLFVVAVERYRKLDEPHRAEEAEKIIKAFLEKESQLYVNLNFGEERGIVEMAVRKQFSEDLFDAAFNDVMGQLEGVLIRWKTTQHYRDVLAQANVRTSLETTNRESQAIQLETLQHLSLIENP